MKDFETYRRLRVLGAKIELAWDSPRRWDLIREFYAIVEPELMNGARIDPYMLCARMTPIEQDIWCEIRYFGLPFYPQYPVGKRFVDFGDPAKNVAIEVDGAAYHTPEKDAEKDAELHAAGWFVHRIKGRDAYRNKNNLAPIMGIYGRDADGRKYPGETDGDPYSDEAPDKE